MKYQSRIEKCAVGMEKWKIIFLGKLFLLFEVWLFYLVVFRERSLTISQTMNVKACGVISPSYLRVFLLSEQ